MTKQEIAEKDRIDNESIVVANRLTIRKNCFHKYPKAVRHNMSLFPNNYLDIMELKEEEKLKRQCDGFEELLNKGGITELDIKRYIQHNGYYHIPASIFEGHSFGHHEAVLFKEFQLGTSYKADYLLAGKASGGWQFIFVEFENPYGIVTLKDGNLGDVIRKGLNQIDDWKTYIEAHYPTIQEEFEKHTQKVLPKEFLRYDATRMHFVVVAGRRNDYDNEISRMHQRRIKRERNIRLMHYDNLLDSARRLIGAQTY